MMKRERKPSGANREPRRRQGTTRRVDQIVPFHFIELGFSLAHGVHIAIVPTLRSFAGGSRNKDLDLYLSPTSGAHRADRAAAASALRTGLGFGRDR